MSDFTNINSSLSSQVSHYQRYNAEYKGFLNELAEEWNLKMIVPRVAPEEVQAIYDQAERLIYKR